MIHLRPRSGAIGDRELGVPMTVLHAELDALVGRGHVDTRDLLHQRALVLQPEAERQIHLAALDIPVVILRPVHDVGFPIDAGWGYLLIRVYVQTARNDVRGGVDTTLLDIEV